MMEEEDIIDMLNSIREEQRALRADLDAVKGKAEVKPEGSMSQIVREVHKGFKEQPLLDRIEKAEARAEAAERIAVEAAEARRLAEARHADGVSQYETLAGERARLERELADVRAKPEKEFPAFPDYHPRFDEIKSFVDRPQIASVSPPVITPNVPPPKYRSRVTQRDGNGDILDIEWTPS